MVGVLLGVVQVCVCVSGSAAWRDVVGDGSRSRLPAARLGRDRVIKLYSHEYSCDGAQRGRKYDGL